VEEEPTILRAYSFLAIFTSNTWPCLPVVILLKRRINSTGEFLLGKGSNLCPTRGGKDSLSVGDMRISVSGYRISYFSLRRQKYASLGGGRPELKYVQYVYTPL
jgi:hypothetical protein